MNFKHGKIFVTALFLYAFGATASYGASAPAIEWARSYGGSGMDRARSIQQTKDGGYVVAGKSNSNDGDVSGNHGDYDFWIVKLVPDL